MAIACQPTLNQLLPFFGEHSYFYQQLYSDFAASTKDDLIIVAGTSGNVIPLKYICHNPAKKLLLNLDLGWIDPAMFDEIVLGKLGENINLIKTTITKLLQSKEVQ